MNEDILFEVRKVFKNESETVIDLLNDFQVELKVSDRLIRCLVVLSEGELSKLKQNIISARIDWRDVIQTATEKYSFDFNQPFR